MKEAPIITLQNFFIVVAASISATIAFSGTNTTSTTTLYGLYCLSIFALLFIAMGNVPIWGTVTPSFIERITHAAPILPIAILTFVLFVLQLENSELLASDNIPDSYLTIKVINFIFYIIALLLIYSYLDKTKRIKMFIKNEVDFNKELNCLGTSGALVVLFSACAGISTFFMYVVLKYLTTDGFTCNKK